MQIYTNQYRKFNPNPRTVFFCFLLCTGIILAQMLELNTLYVGTQTAAQET